MVSASYLIDIHLVWSRFRMMRYYYQRHEADRPNEHRFDYFFGTLNSNDMSPHSIYKIGAADIHAPVGQFNLTKFNG
jgi:hypothetical protein